MAQSFTHKEYGPRIHIEHPYEDEDILVHFVGDMTCTVYSELKYHKNPGFEICLIPYGKGIFQIEERNYPVDGGQIFITKAPQAHAGWPSKENPYRILYICFYIKDRNETVPSVWGELNKELDSIAFPVTYDRFNMGDIHARLMEELLQQGLYYMKITGNIIRQFILLTLRNFKLQDQTCMGYSYKDKNQLVNRVIHFINTHIQHEISLDIVSKTLNYSVSYLSRCFKEHTGFSVIEYYNFARLERAKKYLLETDKTISEIFQSLGYNSIHHFSNAFKNLYGCSPSQFRRIQSKAGPDAYPVATGENFAKIR